jgi:general secretion pathway protein D
MKKLLFPIFLSALALASGCRSVSESPAVASTPVIPARPATLSSFDVNAKSQTIPAQMIIFQQADLQQVLDLYRELSGRSLIVSPQVPTQAKITFRNASALSTIEALQALDTVFAEQGVAMVYLGSQYVKAVPAASAPAEPAPVMELPWRQLPQSSSFLTYIVRLKSRRAEEVVSMLQPFARLPNSIIAMRGSDVLVLRDYSANVRRMLEVLEQMDGNAPR